MNIDHCPMKKLTIILLTVCLALLSACEKAVVTEEQGQENKQEKETPGNMNGNSIPGTFVTVREAQKKAEGEQVCVCGYIVASATKSMANADFCPPFDGSTAIVIADEKVDMENFIYDTDDDLFTICLTHSKSIRAALNMEDHPELWNRRIVICGTRASYLGCTGMKNAYAYRLVDNEN